MISPNKIIGSLVYRTRVALNNNDAFKTALLNYAYHSNCLVDGDFLLWHYPGTPNEISTVLLKIGEHYAGNYLKFPAMLNFQTIKQDKGEDTVIHYNLAIVGSVLSTWTTEQREVEIFDNLLRPIYEEFMNQVKSCKWFKTGYGMPPHAYYEIFTTGKNSGEIQNKYGDYIDAIELHDLALTVNSGLCNKHFETIEAENKLVTSDINKLL